MIRSFLLSSTCQISHDMCLILRSCLASESKQNNHSIEPEITTRQSFMVDRHGPLARLLAERGSNSAPFLIPTPCGDLSQNWGEGQGGMAVAI